MKLRDAYDEAVKCGYTGSMVEWVLSVGAELEDLEEKEDG